MQEAIQMLVHIEHQPDLGPISGLTGGSRATLHHDFSQA